MNSWSLANSVKVTVGVCVKNCEMTIKDTIKSILSQDFPHNQIELIIVDGYSKDKTLSIVKKSIKKADIETKIFRENKGLGYARQIVVDNARGDFIVWVDGDMILSKDFVRKQVEFMERNPKVGIGRARYGIDNESGPVAYLENIPFVVESLRHNAVPLGICGTEGAIYRVSAIRQAGGFDINIKGAAEDIDLARRILNACWLAQATTAVFYERCKESWRELWNQYSWWGYGWHYFFHKTKNLGMLIKMSPLGGFLAGVLRFPFAYKLTNRKLLLFLLPFHYMFKRLAFCYGFSKAHIEGYGHQNYILDKN